MSEVERLIKGGVWDLQPIPRAKAKEMFPEAVFSRLFPILSIKNWETLDEHTYKGRRIVVQGSNTRTHTHTHTRTRTHTQTHTRTHTHGPGSTFDLEARDEAF